MISGIAMGLWKLAVPYLYRRGASHHHFRRVLPGGNAPPMPISGTFTLLYTSCTMRTAGEYRRTG